MLRTQKTYITSRLRAKIVVAAAMLVTACAAYSQDKLELGIFAGGSYYMGDLNPMKQFHCTHPAVGGVARYTFTDRLAAKANVIYGKISGDYPWSGDVYVGDVTDYHFERGLIDIAAMGEFNFRSYDHMFQKDHSRFTPYLTVGVGATSYKRYKNDKDTERVFVISLPFGFGAKYKATQWLRVGLEWTLRKTFADDLDSYGALETFDPSDPYGFADKRLFHNNDWYSFAGVTLTLSMWPRKLACNDGVRNFNR